jgi:Kef-type K+ transport system membrane component KefB
MSNSKKKFFVLYLTTIGLPLLGLIVIFRHGNKLVASIAIANSWKMVPGSGSGPQMFSSGLLVLQLAVILAACAFMGLIFRRLHQPRVIGEMIAGIFLGPSFLGWVAPSLSSHLFPPASLGSLNALSQLGLVLFMFLVGLELNLKELKTQKGVAVFTSHVSITMPLVLGALLALYLYPRLSSSSISFTRFGLFMGAAMSITAFPVLARILAERRLLQSPIATAAITCAAVDDVTGWCIVAYIIFLARSTGSTIAVWLTVAGTLIFAVLMIYAVRPLLRRFQFFIHAGNEPGGDSMLLILIFVLLAAFCSEWLGVHLLFGAFLLGAVMPKEQAFVRSITEQLGPVVKTLLLPLFFAFTGLRTNISLISGTQMWFYCILILFVAIAGKFGGSTFAAWCMGMPLREAAALGMLMNTRGLMELVILNIGLDIGIISPALFSMMVIMALFTTLMATPLLDLIYYRKLDSLPRLQSLAGQTNDSAA